VLSQLTKLREKLFTHSQSSIFSIKQLTVLFPCSASTCNTTLKRFGKVLALQQSLIQGMALRTFVITEKWLDLCILLRYRYGVVLTTGWVQKSTMCRISILGAIANPAASQRTSDGVLRSALGIFERKKMSKWIITSRMQLNIEGERDLHSASPEVFGVVWSSAVRRLI